MLILRLGQRPFEVSLTRAVIRVASVKAHLEPGRVGYVRVTTFAEKTQSEFVAALDQLKREAGGRLDGIVLDLRNDPGGLLDTAVRVAGDFLDSGVIVSTHGRNPGEDETYTAQAEGDRLRGVPVIVLVNGASASASEIVAGALQDRHRATILGTRSFGKGSVQTIIPLDGHGALRLTTARCAARSRTPGRSKAAPTAWWRRRRRRTRTARSPPSTRRSSARPRTISSPSP